MERNAEYNKNIVPFMAVRPGYILSAELKERGIKQKELANMMGISTSHLSEIINGKRAFNLSISMKLEDALGINAKFWMNLQTSYEYDSIVISRQREQFVAEPSPKYGEYPI